MPYNPKGFNDIGGDASMAPSELQPPLNFADGGAVSWAGDSTVYNTQSQIGNMLATPGGFSGMSRQFTRPSPMAMAEGGDVKTKLAAEFAKRGLDLNKFIERRAYAYGGDVRDGDNPGGLRGDTGAYSGRSSGGSEAGFAARAGDTPGFGSGGDRTVGGGGGYGATSEGISGGGDRGDRGGRDTFEPVAVERMPIEITSPAPATTTFGNMSAPFAPGVVPTGIFTPSPAQIAETYRPSQYAGRGFKVEQPGERAGLTAIAAAPLSFTPDAKANIPSAPTSEIESYTKNVLRPATMAQQRSELEAMAEQMRQQANLALPSQEAVAAAPLPTPRPQPQYAGRGEVVEQPGERKSAYEQVLADVVSQSQPSVPLPPIPDRPAMSEVAAATEEDIAPAMFAEPTTTAQTPVLAAVKRPPAPLAAAAPAKAPAATTSEINAMYEAGAPASVPMPPIPYRDLGEGNILDNILKPFGLDTESWINNKASEYEKQGMSPSAAATKASYDLRDVQMNMNKRESGGRDVVAQPIMPVAPAVTPVTNSVTTPVTPMPTTPLTTFNRKYIPLTNYAQYGYGPEATFYNYAAAEGGPVGPLSQKRK